MTKTDWECVEANLMDLYQPIGLICDGYHLALCLERVKMKLLIVFYVNGSSKGAWMLNDCEERRRFLRPVKKSAWNAKSRARMATMSKSMLKKLKVDPKETFVTYYPWWTSFKALKAHLIKNNTNIALAEDWKYQASETQS